MPDPAGYQQALWFRSGMLRKVFFSVSKSFSQGCCGQPGTQVLFWGTMAASALALVVPHGTGEKRGKKAPIAVISVLWG